MPMKPLTVAGMNLLTDDEIIHGLARHANNHIAHLEALVVSTERSRQRALAAQTAAEAKLEHAANWKALADAHMRRFVQCDGQRAALVREKEARARCAGRLRIHSIEEVAC